MAKPVIIDTEHSDSTPEQEQPEEEPQPSAAPPDNPETPPVASHPGASTTAVSPHPADAASTSSQSVDPEESQDIGPTQKRDKISKTTKGSSKEEVSQRAASASPKSLKPEAPDDLEAYKSQGAIPRRLATAASATSGRKRSKIPQVTVQHTSDDEDDVAPVSEPLFNIFEYLKSTSTAASRHSGPARSPETVPHPTYVPSTTPGQKRGKIPPPLSLPPSTEDDDEELLQQRSPVSPLSDIYDYIEAATASFLEAEAEDDLLEAASGQSGTSDVTTSSPKAADTSQEAIPQGSPGAAASLASELEYFKIAEREDVQESVEKREALPDLAAPLVVVVPLAAVGPADGIYPKMQIARTDVKEYVILHSGNLHEKVLDFYLNARTRENLGEQAAINKTSERLKVDIPTVRRIVNDYLNPKEWQ